MGAGDGWLTTLMRWWTDRQGQTKEEVDKQTDKVRGQHEVWSMNYTQNRIVSVKTISSYLIFIHIYTILLVSSELFVPYIWNNFFLFTIIVHGDSYFITVTTYFQYIVNKYASNFNHNFFDPSTVVVNGHFLCHVHDLNLFLTFHNIYVILSETIPFNCIRK